MERLRRDLDAAGADLDAAERQRDALDASRDDVLASEDEAQLEAHDHAVAAVDRRIAVASTKRDRLARELSAAEGEAEQARRQAVYAQGQTALAEARRIIAKEYEPAARALAAILNRAAELQRVGRDANQALPDGAEPLDLILEPGGFNGQHFADFDGLTEKRIVFYNRETGLPAGPYDMPEYSSNAHRWERREVEYQREPPKHPAIPHRSILSYTNLPGFTSDTYIYPAAAWGHARSGRVFETPRIHNV